MRMQKIESYKDLEVWQRGIDLVEMVYSVTKMFPDEERFGLTNQLRRAAISVPSNIAEGWGRNSRKDYLRFLAIARGSLHEVQTQITIAGRVDYLDSDQERTLQDHTETLSRQLLSLMRSLNRSSSSNSPFPNPR